MLNAKTWAWVVLQDFSSRPTHVGNIPQFMKDGETFSDRIAQNSPHAGILLYETWPRPRDLSIIMASRATIFPVPPK